MELPKIIVTSPQDNNNTGTTAPATESENPAEVREGKQEKVGDKEGQKSRVTENGSEAQKTIGTKQKRPGGLPAEKDDLARAHEDVIAQMRDAMLEARGGGGRFSLREKKERMSMIEMD